jgi:hypothetical protein
MWLSPKEFSMKSRYSNTDVEKCAKGQAQLPYFGIPQWSFAPVEVTPRLNLFREDLCVGGSFFAEFAVSSLDEALINFTSHDPFDMPICYGFSFPLASLHYDFYVSSPLSRRTTFEVDTKRMDSLGAPWDLEEEGTIFDLYVNESCRRRLRVGGKTQEEAIHHWHKTATFLRKRIRILKGNNLR